MPRRREGGKAYRLGNPARPPPSSSTADLPAHRVRAFQSHVYFGEVPEFTGAFESGGARSRRLAEIAAANPVDSFFRIELATTLFQRGAIFEALRAAQGVTAVEMRRPTAPDGLGDHRAVLREPRSLLSEGPLRRVVVLRWPRALLRAGDRRMIQLEWANRAGPPSAYCPAALKATICITQALPLCRAVALYAPALVTTRSSRRSRSGCVTMRRV